MSHFQPPKYFIDNGFARTLLVWLAIFQSVFLLSCTKSSENRIRIGYLPYSSSLSVFIAEEKGYFKEAGLNVELVKCASANEALDALRSGKLEFVTGVGLSTFFAMEGASAGSFRCFQPCVEDSTHAVSTLLIPKNSAITEVEQLRGKRVGTYSGTSQVLVLRLLLRKLGFDPENSSDVLIGDVASNLQVDALAAGQFDAFLMLEPYVTKAMSIHGAKPLIENPRVKHILNPFPAGANAVATKFLNAHADLTLKVVNAIDQAIGDIHQDEAAAKAILPKYDATVPPDLAAKSGIYRWWQKSETDLSAIQKYADLLFEGKALTNKVDVKPMFLE